MGTAIVSLLSIGIMLTGTLMLARGSIFSFEELSEALQTMEHRIEQTARTKIAGVSATTLPGDTDVKLSGCGERVIRNSGEISLSDFQHWDMLVQYTDSLGDLSIQFLAYSTSSPPASGQWAVDGIFRDVASSTAEVLEPGILNPSEEVVLLTRVSPNVGTGTDNVATVSTSGGVATSLVFSN